MSNLPLFMEGVKIVPGLSNQAANAAGTCDIVSLENYGRVAILVTQRQGGATASSITFTKLTAISGGTSDSTNAIPNYWYMADVTVGTTADTWTKGTAVASGSTIATSLSASGVSYYLIDIGAEELPESGYDYKCVQCVMGGTGHSSNYIDVMYFLYNPRYGQATLPSAQA